MGYEKRDTTEILAEILAAAQGGTRKTTIIRSANTNHMRGTVYLETCVSAGLVVEQEEQFFLTDKGASLLERWGEIEELLPTAQDWA